MPHAAVNLATLRQDLQDRWESQAFWVDIEARLFLNQALRWWNLLTGRWKRRVIVNTVASVPWVSLPSTLVYPVTIRFQDNPALRRSSISDLSMAKVGWEGHTTTDGGDIPTTPRLWAPAGLDLFAIWPADAVGGLPLLVDSVRQTPVLVNDVDFVDLTEAEHHVLLGEALFIGAFKLGGDRLAATVAFHKAFLAAAADQNDRIRASTYFRKAAGLDTQRGERPLRSFPSAAAILGAKGAPIETQELT